MKTFTSDATSINCADCTHCTVERSFIKFPRSSSSLPYHFCNKPLFSPLSDCQAQRFDLKGKIIHKWYIDVPPEGQMMIFLLLWKKYQPDVDQVDQKMMPYHSCFIWECSFSCIISCFSCVPIIVSKQYLGTSFLSREGPQKHLYNITCTKVYIYIISSMNF